MENNPHCLPQGLNPELLQLILERAPVGFALVAECGKFLWANREACTFWERSLDNLKAIRWQDITHCDDIATDENRVQSLLNGLANSYNLAKRYIMPDGRVKWALLTVFRSDHPGTPLCAMIQGSDDLSRKIRYMRGFSGTTSVTQSFREMLKEIADARQKR